jgi:hypothetical protein
MQYTSDQLSYVEVAEAYGVAKTSVPDVLRRGWKQLAPAPPRPRTEIKPEGEEHPNHVLTDEQASAMREQASEGFASYRALGEAYGVTGKSAWRIVTGQAWKHLLSPEDRW